MIDLSEYDLPELTGSDKTACALVFQAHAAADWATWGKRALRYWDAFEENIKLGTYRGDRLADWWEHMQRKMGVGTPYKDHRQDLAILLATTPARPVLDALYERAGTFVLYQRVVSDVKKVTRADQTVTSGNPGESFPFEDEETPPQPAQGALL